MYGVCNRARSPCLIVSLLCLQIEVLSLGLSAFLCGLHKKTVESPLGPPKVSHCAVIFRWQQLPVSGFHCHCWAFAQCPSPVSCFSLFCALRNLELLLLLFSLELESISQVAKRQESCFSPSELEILQQAAEAVTSKCKVKTAGILLKDRLLQHCAGKEKLDTTASVLLVVCSPAAKSKVIALPCLGFQPKELVVTADRSLGAEYMQTICSADN